MLCTQLPPLDVPYQHVVSVPRPWWKRRGRDNRSDVRNIASLLSSHKSENSNVAGTNEMEQCHYNYGGCIPAQTSPQKILQNCNCDQTAWRGTHFLLWRTMKNDSENLLAAILWRIVGENQHRAFIELTSNRDLRNSFVARTQHIRCCVVSSYLLCTLWQENQYLISTSKWGKTWHKKKSMYIMWSAVMHKHKDI